MAGHSHAKNVARRKDAVNRVKGKIFSKLAKELTIAAKGGTDPSMNAQLRSAILAARAENMPKDNIERAISKASGADQANFEEVRYEGYGPGNVAIIVEALTDNRARTAPEVRSVFTKLGGIMGETNSVSFNFDRVGLIVFPKSAGTDDAVFEAAVNAGADDVESDDDKHYIYTAVDTLSTVRDALEKVLGTPEAARLDFKTKVESLVSQEDIAKKALALIDALDDLDDVQRVTSNLALDESIADKV